MHAKKYPSFTAMHPIHVGTYLPIERDIFIEAVPPP